MVQVGDARNDEFDGQKQRRRLSNKETSSKLRCSNSTEESHATDGRDASNSMHQIAAKLSLLSQESSEKEVGSNIDYDHANEDEDDVALMMANLLSTNENFATFGSLAERASIINSINWLGRHVPQCVLKELSCEMMRPMGVELAEDIKGSNQEQKSMGRNDQMKMPHATQYEAALLFIDMSGFTKISQQLDVESLSKAINSYFHAIVDEVTSHGGDILKFAGDAIFAEWRTKGISESPKQARSVKQKKYSPDANVSTSRARHRNETKAQKEKVDIKLKRQIKDRKVTTAAGQKSKAQHSRARVNVKSSTSTNSGGSISTSSFETALVPAITLDDCVHTAAICGASIVKKCADYPVYAKTISGVQGDIVATLNVHCGLGVGEMVGVHVGNDYSRREYLVFGDPIDQVAEACDSAELGEIRASGNALKRLNRSQPYKYQMKCDNGCKSVLIASGKKAFFSKKKCKAWPLDGKIRKRAMPRERNFSIPFDSFDNNSLKRLQKLLSFYVHPVVAADEIIEEINDSTNINSLGEKGLRQSIGRNQSIVIGNDGHIKPSQESIQQLASAQERHRSEAELRSVFTIFIMPKIEARLTNDPVKNEKTFQLLNDIMNIVTSILYNYKGHLRQYIVDDKGVVLIATFGLRGSTFPNMVSERALPTCRLIHSALESELGVDNQIGATLGKVYCGIVGGVERHEFAVLGPSVNLSARLMAQKNHPGVLVDNEVRLKAKKFNFIKFPPVKAKGYVDLVPVFKPLTAKESRWGKVNAKYVGRKKEMETVCNLAVEMSRAECKSKMFFLWGESGSGKSSFVVHTIAKMHKALVANRKSSIITRNICSDGDTLVPFSLFRSIFRDVLSEKPIDDEASFASKGSSKEFNPRASFSTLSSGSSHRTSVIGRLRGICEEMNAPEGFLEIVGHHLLGNSNLKMSSVKKAPELGDIVTFMAEVFIRTTSHAEITILALDDVQWMDNLSWKVVRNIFERSKNVLIVCCSRLLEDIPLTMDKDFWEMLNGKYRDSNLYYETYIGALEKSEVREMAALTLKCKPGDISDKYINDVYMHSGGMPYFASEILENCLRNNLFRRYANNKIGWRQQRRNSQEGLHYTNLNELLLLRIDNLDDLTRKALHFASVLGASFELQEIVEISGHILCIPEEEKEQHSLAIKLSLEAAVEEGILDVTVQDEGSVDEEHSKISMMMIDLDDGDGDEGNYEETATESIYTFCHSTWRRLILSMLLDSWKRDIHKHAAMAIEARSPDPEARDYRTKVKLFQHWKDSDHTVKAASFALDIGQSFKLLGLNLHSIKIYDDALEMWRKHKPNRNEEAIGGFAPDVLDSLDEDNLVHLIKLLTMFGQAVGSAYMEKRSAQAFEDALTILRFAPISFEIKDRAFIFPIYSGLFFLLKYGNLVDPSEQPSYEVELVSNFVNETKKHGDPIHYGRALAMQGETFHRQGKFVEAIESHLELKRVYDVDKHSAQIVASYASDRCAQNFGLSANCYVRLGKIEEALELIDHIITNLMPKMDPKNVHNSMVSIYPAIWILKDNGKSEVSKEIFLKFVLGPFNEFFGEGGKTPFLPTFRPVETLLDLVLYTEGKIGSFDEGSFDWALDLNNLKWKMSMDIAIGGIGRSIMSINAEICLRLSRLTDDSEKKSKLIENGMTLATQAISGCDGSDGSRKLLSTYCQIKPVYDELKKLSQ